MGGLPSEWHQRKYDVGGSEQASDVLHFATIELVYLSRIEITLPSSRIMGRHSQKGKGQTFLVLICIRVVLLVSTIME